MAGFNNIKNNYSNSFFNRAKPSDFFLRKTTQKTYYIAVVTSVEKATNPNETFAKTIINVYLSDSSTQGSLIDLDQPIGKEPIVDYLSYRILVKEGSAIPDIGDLVGIDLRSDDTANSYGVDGELREILRKNSPVVNEPTSEQTNKQNFEGQKNGLSQDLVPIEPVDLQVVDQVDAWESGRLIGKINVVKIGSKLVEENTARAFLQMQQAAAKDGIKIFIRSGYRSNDEQTYFYNLYKQGRGNIAARPGYSNHQNGKALDLNTEGITKRIGTGKVYEWLEKNAHRYNFKRIDIEHWHWEYKG